MRWVVVLAALAACYAPKPHPGAACAAGDVCPDGLVCSHATQTCEPSDRDAGGVLPDGQLVFDAPPDDNPADFCVGAGLLHECFASRPSGTVTLKGTLSTDATGACSPDFAEVCVIAGDSILVTDTAVFTGARPIVLVGSTIVQVTSTGTIDASSHLGGAAGAGNGTALCGGTKPAHLGGGGGGSFTTRGGNGGKGILNGSVGGISDEADPDPMVLRSGCDGQDGDFSGTPGDGGKGGGVLYIAAGEQIDIQGHVLANGAGGHAGVANSGGGGGGAGGMIVLDAPEIDVGDSAFVVAVGGGGGEGGGLMPGASGEDGHGDGTPGAGGAGLSTFGGDGGAGSSIDNGTDGGDNTSGPSLTGAGGGGGGGGAIRVYGTFQAAKATITPPPLK